MKKGINKLTDKTAKWMDSHPSGKKIIVGTVVGGVLVGIGYILGNRKRKE